MGVGNVFMTATPPDSPLDGSRTDPSQNQVSEFLTVQSLTNFAAMTGAIITTWHALQLLDKEKYATTTVPFLLAIAWAVISVSMSLKTLVKGDWKDWVPAVLAALFVAAINSLVLFSAVVGADGATGT